MEYIVQADQDRNAGLKATIYTGGSYSGTSQQLGVGRYDLDQLTVGNDTISSVRVPEGLLVTLYQHHHFDGSKYFCEQDISSLSGTGFDNITSSITVQLACKVYQHGSYGGVSQTLPVGSYKMSELAIPNDSLSSIKVPTGLAVTIFEHDNFQGPSRTFTKDISSVGDFNDKASSITVFALSISIPADVIAFGDTISLRGFNGKHIEANGGYTSLGSAVAGVLPESSKFTLLRSGNTKHHSLLCYGDTITLKSHENKYVVAETIGTNSYRLDANRTAIGSWEKFTVIKTGQSKSKCFVSAGDTITLKSAHGTYLTWLTSSTGINATSIGDSQRWSIGSLSPKSAVWAITTGNQIYRRDQDDWTLVSGSLKQISVGSPQHVWGVNSSDNIYQWNGSSWTQISGNLKNVSVTYDGTVWGVAPNNGIYRRENGNWSYKGGSFESVSAGSAEHVWAIKTNGDVYRWNGSGFDYMGVNFYRLSVGYDGTVWAITDSTNWNVYIYNGNEFVLREGIKTQLSVAGKGLVWAVNAGGYLYQLGENNSWIGRNDKPAAIKWVSMGLEPVSFENAFNLGVEDGDGDGCGAKACDSDACAIEVCGAQFCGADGCAGAACLGATCGADFCATAACTAAVCGSDQSGIAVCGVNADILSLCGMALCGADACGAAGCAGNACGLDYCAGAICGAEGCGGDACGANACVGYACGADGCGGNACGVASCPADVCGAAACGGNSCGLDNLGSPADVCGANACGVNLCAVDACGADACGIDVIPIIPGI